MIVDIYVREKNGIREIRIPILPEEIQFHSGNATFIKYDIMGIGEVAEPSGAELGKFYWKSEFPGFDREYDPMIRGTWYQPSEYDSILRDWQKNGTELTLIGVGYPINSDVYISEYHPAASGPFGDIYYEISFAEARHISITSATDVESAVQAIRTKVEQSTYTVKQGDTLWSIAQKVTGSGSNWGGILSANKDIIEAMAKKNGKSSSENGHWIYPGVTLTIPSKSTNETATGQETKSEAEKKNEGAYTSKRGTTLDSAVEKILNP